MLKQAQASSDRTVNDPLQAKYYAALQGLVFVVTSQLFCRK
jgi:hypothetical protein